MFGVAGSAKLQRRILVVIANRSIFTEHYITLFCDANVIVCESTLCRVASRADWWQVFGNVYYCRVRVQHCRSTTTKNSTDWLVAAEDVQKIHCV